MSNNQMFHGSQVRYTNEPKYARNYISVGRADAAIKRLELSHEHIAFVGRYRGKKVWRIEFIYGRESWFVEREDAYTTASTEMSKAK
jgi:hypothetical protein